MHSRLQTVNAAKRSRPCAITHAGRSRCGVWMFHVSLAGTPRNYSIPPRSPQPAQPPLPAAGSISFGSRRI